MNTINDTGRRSNLAVIQVFRGWAAVSVVLYHITKVFHEKFHLTYLWDVFKVGYVGVDFFFILSGFIICYVHYRDIGKRDKLRTFLYKRFVRIFPIYWILCITLTIMYFAVPSFGDNLYRSIHTVAKSFILIPQENPRPLPVSWTLSYEIFFYAIFSMFMLVRSRYVVVCMALWGGLSLCNALGILIHSDSFYINYLFNGLNTEFLLGCLVAYAVVNYGRKLNHRMSVITLCLGLAGALLSWYLVYTGSTSLNRAILFGPPFALLVLGVALYDLRKSPKVPKVMLGIGDASYSIYLTHCDFITLLEKVVLGSGLFGLLNHQYLVTCMVVIVVSLGYLCYRMVEKPTLDILRSKMPKSSHLEDSSRGASALRAQNHSRSV